MCSLTARNNIISFEQSQACFTLIYVSLYHVICPFQFNTAWSCIFFFFFHFLQEYFMLRQQEMLTGTFTNSVTLIMFSMNFSLAVFLPVLPHPYSSQKDLSLPGTQKHAVQTHSLWLDACYSSVYRQRDDLSDVVPEDDRMGIYN